MRTLLIACFIGCAACSGNVSDTGPTSGGGGASSTGTRGSHASSTGGAGQTSSHVSTGVSGLADAASSSGSVGLGGGGASASGGSDASGGSAASGGSDATGGSSQGSGGGTAACVGHVSLVIDNGAPQALHSICANEYGSGETTQPDGYYFAGGPVGAPRGLRVDGCASSAPASLGIELEADDVTAPGTFTTGGAQYVDANGQTWSMDDNLSITITRIGPVGSTIDGSFSVGVNMGGNAEHLLSGNFSVCRVRDEDLP